MLDDARKLFGAPTRYRNVIAGGFSDVSDGGVIERESLAPGRETGRYGLREYTELRSVHLRVGPHTERGVEAA